MQLDDLSHVWVGAAYGELVSRRKAGFAISLR